MKHLFFILILTASTPLIAMYSKGDEILLRNDTVCNEGGDTLLMCAVRQGNTEAVQALLPLKNTDVNAQNNFGLTALHIAVFKGDIKMCKLLLCCGAGTDQPKTKNGLSAQDLIGLHSCYSASTGDLSKLFFAYKTGPCFLSKEQKEKNLAVLENQ